jgi:hypothetical protein
MDDHFHDIYNYMDEHDILAANPLPISHSTLCKDVQRDQYFLMLLLYTSCLLCALAYKCPNIIKSLLNHNFLLSYSMHYLYPIPFNLIGEYF